ncbi:MAG TPA: hypothetical protein PKM57_12360 [Kiritimatiellia bacterium]|nr:hypothetical protein [Kiritimatiellia bacterium]HPS06158.1 hypothetical protein [Kiritimatiellia bacterium]
MIIQSLRVVLEEAQIAAKLKGGLAAANQLKDVTFSLMPGTVKVGGKFQVGFAIPFETHWTADVLDQGRRLGVRLSHVSVGMIGLSAAMVTSQVMNALSQKLQGVAGLSVENDTILLDPAVLLAAKGIRLDAPVRRIDVKQGSVEIEVG